MTEAAREALKAHLRDHRKRYPPVLRVSLLVSAVCWAAMAAIVVVSFLFDRATFFSLLWFIGITTVAGGQAAAFYAFGPRVDLSLWLVILMGVLNMAATLFLIVPLAWRAVEGLRDARFIGNILMAAEQMAWRRRHFLARWGLLGLGIIAVAPVQGAGVLGAGALGVVLRVPLPRLLVVLGIVGAIVNVAWAIIIKVTASALPTGGLWDLLPWVVIVLLVVVGIVAARMGKREASRVSIESFGWIDEAQRKRLTALGIKGGFEFMHVNLKKLAQKLDIPASQLGRCRNVAGLLRLSSLKPEAAVQLTEVGVARIRDLAQTPPALVQRALEEADPKHAPTMEEAKAWHTEAKAFVAETRLQREAKEDEAGPGKASS
ncbi:MAG TPA: DUF4332 domain-containing protein [Candidatus Thermoplasmatota archaeon]|nr:DUF4332 domain-containing protein [Candidatus Thermoplasmatota archaeon]